MRKSAIDNKCSTGSPGNVFCLGISERGLGFPQDRDTKEEKRAERDCILMMMGLCSLRGVNVKVTDKACEEGRRLDCERWLWTKYICIVQAIETVGNRGTGEGCYICSSNDDLIPS